MSLSSFSSFFFFFFFFFIFTFFRNGQGQNPPPPNGHARILVNAEIYGRSLRAADFSVGLWLGFGWGYFSLVRVRVGINQFG